MRRINPEQFLSTHYEQYLEDGDEWLGVYAVAQIVAMAQTQLPNVKMVVVTFEDEPYDCRGEE